METNISHLLTGYDKVLRSLAVHFTRGKQEIDDLVQETYYRALMNSDKFTEGTNLRAWLATIMRNIFINNYHRNIRVINAVPGESNLYNRLGVARNNSHRTFLKDEIDRALKMTARDYTEAFLMHHQGFQYQEIAETLDIPLGTVKSRIFSARKELQQRLMEVGIENAASI